MTAHARLAALRAFIVDLDGTTYVGQRAIPGAAEFFHQLRASGRPYLFVTNNSSTSAAAYVDKLRRLEVPVDHGQVLTSGEATAMFLERRGRRRLYVVGTPSLEQEMQAAGFVLDADTPDTVVLGFDRTLTYAKLETAARHIAAGVEFVATHPDVVCPTETGYIPDCGSMIALLTAATGVSPTVVGKPEPLLVEMALARLGCSAGEVAVVGDRLYTDMLMARRSGTFGVLVLSGETTRAVVEGASHPPELVVDDLRALGALLPPLDAGRVLRVSQETA